MIDTQPMTTYELISLIISALGFVAVVVSLAALFRQTRLLVTSSQCDTYESVTSNLSATKSIFIEHPELRPYFYGLQEINENDPNYPKAVATAEHLLDFFDGVLLQQKHSPQLWNDGLWKNYIRDCFSSAPILRDHLAKHKEWYTPELLRLLSKTANAPTPHIAKPQTPTEKHAT